jgi:hypothetical protein
MARQTLADVAVDLLRDHASRTSAEIAAEAVARRATKAKNPAASVRKVLQDDLRFVPVAPDAWVLHERVAAVPVRHRITPEEAASGTLAVGIDLGTIQALVPTDLRATDGARLQVLRGRTASLATGVDTGVALRGPEGWPGFPAGSLVAVSVAGRTVSVREAPETSAADRMRGRRLLAITREVLARPEPGDLGGPFIGPLELIAEFLAAEDDAASGPLPPLSEVYEGSGLVTHHGWVGLPETDWDALDDLVARMRRYLSEAPPAEEDGDIDDIDDIDVDFDDDADDEDVDDEAGEPPGFDDRTFDKLVDQHALKGSEATALGVALDLFVVWDVPGRDGTPPSTSVTMRRNLAEMIGLPRVAIALADYATTDPRLERFAADLWASTVGRREGAGPAYLLGAIAESRGDVALAERRFREAMSLDRWCVPADLGLLGFEIDRGDYPAALARMRRLGFPDDEPDRRWVASLVVPAVARVGRNDPCPCGSGRKYKTCHLDRPAVAGDVDPIVALQRKIARFMLRPDAERALEALVHEALGYPDADDLDAGLHDEPWFTDAESRLLDENPDVAMDILLAERGWMRRFLDLRGSLLPSVERDLAESWIDTRMRLYEVVSTSPGSGLVLRDIVDAGPPVEVRDRLLSRGVAALDLVLLRLRPDGRGGVAPSDGVLVPRGDRFAVASLVGKRDTVGLLRYIALPEAPPRVQNMDGDPIRLVTATYRVPDPAAAREALARELEEHEPGHFAVTMDRRGQAWTQGTIAFEGDVATIDANSRARADAMVGRLLAAAPDAQLIERREQSIEEAMAKLEGADPAAAGGGSPVRGGTGPLAGLPEHLANSPEVWALLDETVRRFERDWVDASIPALGGRTPREAIRSSTGLAEVEALLDDMAWMKRRAGEQGGAGMMDADRIRELLGLRQKPG